VYAVDIKADKLALAENYGAIPVNAQDVDPVEEIKRLTDGRGVDVALELIGLPVTMRQALDVLAVFGRLGLVGLNEEKIEVDPYWELLGREAEIIGVSDHLASEMPTLIEYARSGKLDLSKVISHTVPLDAEAINATFDELDSYSHAGRVVIVPL
jgi:propanol-preferring alcohol dehydrogenase